MHSSKYAQFNEYIDEYLSGMHLIESNSTLLPISFSHKGITSDGKSISFRVEPFRHLSGYIGVNKGIIDFTHYQARTGHFPIEFRSQKNPYILIGRRPDLVHHGLESNPPQISLLAFKNRIPGIFLDYVLVWNPFNRVYKTYDFKLIYQQIEANYKLIYKSPQRGWMKLYRRKNWNSSKKGMPLIE